tara:strand:+ start:1045 stop:5811 length:4767 start_codon:yes stop_codon:yes gene_type:complete
MSKRPSRGVTSGVGTPTRMTGRDGDLTIRKTRQGKILYVKEHGFWHPINTGVDTLKLQKDVDRLMRSVNTIRNDNSPFSTIDTLDIRRDKIKLGTSGTGLTFKNSSGTLNVNNADDTDTAKISAKTLTVSGTPSSTGEIGFDSNVVKVKDSSGVNNLMMHTSDGLVKRTRSTGSADIIFDADNLTIQDTSNTSIETKFTIGHLATSSKTSIKLWEDTVKVQTNNPSSASEFQNYPMIYSTTDKKLFVKVGSEAKFVTLTDSLDFSYDITAFGFNQSQIVQEIGGSYTPISGSAPTGYWKAAGDLEFNLTYQNGPPTTVTITAALSSGTTGWTGNDRTVAGSGSTSQTVLSSENLNYPTAIGGTATFSVTSSPAPDDGTYPSNKVVTFKNPLKIGTNSSTTVADATLNSLSTKLFNDSSENSLTVGSGSGQHIYYAFPARSPYTRLNGEYNFRHQGMTAGFTETTYEHTNIVGYKENYYAYVQQIANAASSTLTTSTSQGLLNQMFFGVHGDNTITNSDLNSIDSSPTISDNIDRSLGNVTTTSGEYLVFSYDADHDNLNSDAFQVDGYTAGFTQQTTSNYQNPAGRTANYKSYVSNVTNITADASKSWNSDSTGSVVLQRKWGFITGVSDPASFSSANFKALTNASYNKDSTNNDSTTWGTKTCPSNARLVLCIPSGQADINIDEGSNTSNDVKFGGVSCGFEKASNQSLENDFGYTANYDVYISKRTNMNRNNSGALSILASNTDNNEHIWGIHTESATSITELTSDELYALTEGGNDDTESNYDNYRVIQSSMDVGANEFITYAHRADETDLTVGRFRFNGITMGMTKLSSTVAYKNRNGFTENFDVYVSDTHNLSLYQGAGDFEYSSSSSVLNHTYWGKIDLGASWNNTKDLSTDLVSLVENGTVTNALNTSNVNKVISNTYSTNNAYGNITTDSTNWFVFAHRDTGNTTLNANQFQLQVDPGNSASRITMAMIKNPVNNIYEHTNNSGYKEDYEVWVSKNYGYNEGVEWKFYLSSTTTIKNQYFYGYKVDNAGTPATVSESDLNTGAGITIAYDGGVNVDVLASTSIAATTNRRIVFAAADARIEDKESGNFRVNGFTAAFTKQDLDNFTNVAGYVENYDVWISDKHSMGTVDFEMLGTVKTLNQIRVNYGTNATPTANAAFIDTLTQNNTNNSSGVKINIAHNTINNQNINTNPGTSISPGFAYIPSIAAGNYIYVAIPRRHSAHLGEDKFQWSSLSGSDYSTPGYAYQLGHAGFNCLTSGGAVSWTNSNGFTEDYDIFVSVKPTGSDMGTEGTLGYREATSTDTYKQVYFGPHSSNGISAANIATLSGKAIRIDAVQSTTDQLDMSTSAASGEYIYFSVNDVETNLTTGTDYSSASTGTSFVYDGLTMGVKAQASHSGVVGGFGQSNNHDTYQSEITNMRGGATCDFEVYTTPKLINRWYYGSSSTSDVSSMNNAQLATFLSGLTANTLSNGTVLGDITTSATTPEALFSVNALPANDEFIWFVYPTRYKTANVTSENTTGFFTYHIPHTLPFNGGMGGYGSFALGEGHIGNFTNDVGWTESYVFVRSENHSLGSKTVRVLA